MNRTFESAMTAIMDIENAINATRKQRKKSATGYSFVMMIMVMLGCSVSASAVTKNNADTEYQKGNYQQAIRDYEEILNNYGVSAEVYYNLGNAYYRTDNITKAVLNYERAQSCSRQAMKTSASTFSLHVAKPSIRLLRKARCSS